MINYRNLPIYNPKRDIVGTNAYVAGYKNRSYLSLRGFGEAGRGQIVRITIFKTKRTRCNDSVEMGTRQYWRGKRGLNRRYIGYRGRFLKSFGVLIMHALCLTSKTLSGTYRLYPNLTLPIIA